MNKWESKKGLGIYANRMHVYGAQTFFLSSCFPTMRTLLVCFVVLGQKTLTIVGGGLFVAVLPSMMSFCLRKCGEFILPKCLSAKHPSYHRNIYLICNEWFDNKLLSLISREIFDNNWISFFFSRTDKSLIGKAVLS